MLICTFAESDLNEDYLENPDIRKICKSRKAD